MHRHLLINCAAVVQLLSTDHKFLQNKKILSVSIASLVSGTKYRGEFEERINKIIKEVEEDGNIILFIDEVHTIVGKNIMSI